MRRTPERLTEVRETMEHNREERAGRTPKQQLGALDFRLGKGAGAKRERARLEKGKSDDDS